MESKATDRRDQKFPWIPAPPDARLHEVSFLGIAKDLDDAVLITDTSHTVQYVNQAFERRSGYAAAEIIGKNVNMLKSGLVPGHVYRDLWETIMGGRPWRAQLINRRKDGLLYEVDLLISPVVHEGEITWFLGIQRDISEAKRLQRASAHMASLGTMAAGVVHDLRSPLSSIAGSLEIIELILARMEAGSPELQREAVSIRKALAVTQNGMESLHKLISDITNLVRDTPTTPAVVGAAQVVTSALRLSGHFLEGVRLLEEMDPEMCLYVSALDIERAVINLLDNAAWAAKRSGRVPEVRIKVGPAAPNDVQICIADNGRGLPPEVLEKMFAVPATTKPMGEGSGLGLLTVGELAKKNHGEVKVLSTGEAGTVFALQFPRAVCT